MSVLIKWNPISDIFLLDETISQVLDQVSEFVHRRKMETLSAWVPVADMYETDTTMVIHAELAGIDKHSLEIVFQEGHLIIRGNRPFGGDMQSAKIHRIERMYGAFRRAFWIPVVVDPQKISASYERGVLKIILPKQKPFIAEQVKVPITFK